jgi:hypothetical protein
MSVAPDAPFSDLVNRPKDTVARLQRSAGGRLRLRRRDDEDLMLTTASRVEQESEVVSAATRMFVALMKNDAGVRVLVTEVVPEVFPWVRFLPVEDVRAFVVELVDTLRAVEDLDTTAPVAQVIAEWQHTAEVYADPELLAVLRRETFDDFGPVPEPDVVG